MAHQDSFDFELNPGKKMDVLTIGNEGHSILVIDNLMRDPGSLVHYAVQKVGFKPVPPGQNHYPGVRAPAPRNYSLNLMDALRPLVAKYMGIGTDQLEAARCAYSIATTRPEDLTLTQRLPHFDTVHRHQIAAVHYLCEPAHGGTALNRQRSTGFESVTRERSNEYFDAMKADIEKFGAPGPTYFTATDKLFDRISHIDACFNRIVVYPSILLHSGMVNAAAGLSGDPEKGRLTTTLFARFSPDV